MTWAVKLEAALCSGLRRIPMVDEDATLIADYPTEDIRKCVLLEYIKVSKNIPILAKARLDDYFIRVQAYRKGSAQPNKGFEEVPSFSLSEVLSEVPEAQSFFEEPVDCRGSGLVGDPAPLVVAETMPLGKVHFLFMMLGAQQLYVTRKGVLVGVITRESFSKHGT
jgi:hypothetical protein